MTAPKNPAAFPNDSAFNHQPGMTLRDWFAGQALAAWIAKIDIDEPAEKWIKPKTIAGACYAQADALLAERERRA